ncbi:MAG: VWA domain-containing protein [Chitinophagaceae bacterium]
MHEEGDKMFDLQFQYPQALWLLAVVPLLLLVFVFYLLWRARSARRLGDSKLILGLQKNHSGIKTVAKFALLLIAFSAGCIAVANPRKPEPGGDETRKGVDIVLALDVSNSMLATDLSSSDRLTKAKEFVSRLVRTMPENRYALLLFAGQAYVQMPLTFDLSATELFLATANPGTIKAQGTAINEALLKAEPVFSSTIERFKSIVLITDGEAHDEGAVTTATELASRGILIHTVGIGSSAGTAIPDAVTGAPKKDGMGNVILSKLNEGLLQQIASAAKGVYVNITNSNEAVVTLVGEFAAVEKKALVDVSLLNYQTFYYWFGLPMLLLLLIEIFLPDRKKVKQ